MANSRFLSAARSRQVRHQKSRVSFLKLSFIPLFMHGVVNLTVRISKQTKITRVGMENEIWGLFPRVSDYRELSILASFYWIR